MSRDTISDKVVEEMTEWFNRPLDRVYPVIFIDAIVVKVRDWAGPEESRPMSSSGSPSTVNGTSCNLGRRPARAPSSGSAMLTEVKNRGVADVCIAVL